MEPRSERCRQILPEPDPELSSVLERWFGVSGDVDDFIFYDEPGPNEH